MKSDLMKIIVFDWTRDALLAGRKTCARRLWSKTYAQELRAGELMAAYDWDPCDGGQHMGTIRLTRTPYQHKELPPEDWENEGFDYLEHTGAHRRGSSPRMIWDDWLRAGVGHLWVVRFELVSIEPGYIDYLAVRPKETGKEPHDK